MENVARVVLALEAHDVVEEVMHFLDRSGRARVVATASDDRQLAAGGPFHISTRRPNHPSPVPCRCA